MSEPVHPNDLTYLRSLLKPMVLLVLLTRLGWLPSGNRIAEMLKISRRTVSAYLGLLKQLGLIQAAVPGPGYILSENLSERNRRLMKIFIITDQRVGQQVALPKDNP